MIDRRFLNVNFVVTSVANSPASNPTAGTQYIVGSNPTGAFAGASPNKIARFNGTKWKFITPKSGDFEVFNIATNAILRYDGSAWNTVVTVKAEIGEVTAEYVPLPPVLDIVPTGTRLPTTATTGDKFLRTSNGKFYTAIGTNDWNSGVALSDGDRYASTTDFKIYTYDEDEQDFIAEGVASGGIFFNKNDTSLYVYDGTINSFTKASASADAGGSNIVTETHILTASEATAKSFSLANSVKTGEESSMLLFINGLLLKNGADFTASGNTISWATKNLDGIGLRAGDNFVIQYIL